MANITYDDFVKACNKNDFEKFNGEIPFEITFEEWAKINDKNDKANFKVILTDSGLFNIVDQDGELLDIADILNKDNFTECKFYEKEKKKIKKLSFDEICKPISSKSKNFRMAEFYTIIFLWCLKIKGNEIFEELTNEELTNNEINFTGGTGKFIEVNNKPIHLGVNADKLNKRIPYLINNYLRDYYAYKVIFTPNIKNSSNSIGNGGNAMSENNKDFNIKDIIKEKIEKHKQIIFTGAPGTGKTYAVKQCVKTLVNDDDSRYKFVQFHASYDYTDFVEGIRPMPNVKSGENIFVRVDGQFKSFCRMIVEANKPDDMYYFIIDEINRADLSKVFGELMYGLEESYRGKDNRFDTQYQNLPTYKYDKKENKAVKIEDDVFADGFYVPENLTIIGTMNDIDRSVETFDFALRRRFTWVEIKANDVMLNSVTEININDKGTDDISKIAEKITAIKEKIIAMNNVISGDTGKSLGLNESYHIGPAYFKNLFDEDYNDNLETIFSERIEPLLREYVRGRSADKINNFITECKKILLAEVSGDTDAEE